MNVYLWMGFPGDYFHVAIVVIAPTVEKAVELALEKAQEKQTALLNTEVWPGFSLEQWLTQNAILINTDVPQIWWSEHWS